MTQPVAKQTADEPAATRSAGPAIVIDDLPHPALVLDGDGSITHHNEAAAELIGALHGDGGASRQTDLRGLALGALLQAPTAVAAMLEASRADGPAHGEHRQLVRDREGRTLSLSARQLVDRRERHLVLVEDRTLRRDFRLRRLLIAISRSCLEAPDRYSLLQSVCRLAVTSGLYRFAWVGLRQPGEERIAPMAMAGIEGYDPAELRASADPDDPEGAGTVGEAVRTRTTQIAEDLQTNPRFGVWHDDIHAHGLTCCVTLPLLARKEVVGTLTLYTDTRVGIGADEVDILETIAGHVAFSFDHLESTSRLRQAEATVRYLSGHDTLTGLPNRALFADRLARAIDALEPGHRVAVLYVDLDRFSTINESMGPGFTDRLLTSVAARLRSWVGDRGLAARQSGDEFTVMLRDEADLDAIEASVQSLHRDLAGTFLVEGREVRVTSTIGIALHPEDGRGPDELVRNAVTAMYRSREGGYNHYQFYTPDMNARSLERMDLEHDLRRALEQGQFQMHYQPQGSLATGDIVGVEALLRWQHPQLGFVPPSRFVPMLEETGLIAEVGAFALHEACAQARRWRDAGLPPLRVGINLSAQQFRTRKLADQIAAAVSDTGVDPAMIELELTESLLMEDTAGSLAILDELASMAIGIAIDDFGTGYSSLSYLHRLPLDSLKIDRTFVREVHEDADAAAIVDAILAMSKSLGLRVIAEGVEKLEQVHFLRDRDCDEAQGYVLSRPLTADELAALVRKGRKLRLR